MNSAEFRLEFDTLYDNISSGSAPGLDDYERSFFLSKAQDELVKKWYSTEFENTERARRGLANLVFTSHSTEVVTDGSKLLADSILIAVPAELQYILAEVVITGTLKTLNVKPVLTDEINIIKDNPFKRPSIKNIEKYALRLDRGYQADKRVVELLLYDDTISKYVVRYIKKPNPIILSDLSDLGAGISIEGKINETLCELDSSVHRDIVDRAVELALEAFEQQRLQTKVQLNQRNN